MPSQSSCRTSPIPKVGAVAGNAKVGNRVNLWTRWQALEYITSQNFERRALDLFNVVTVVPGAIGAWRTDAVRARRRLPHQHRRRRCRPHHEPARAGLQGHLRRSGARLHRSAGQRQRAHAPALPLVLRHPAGGLQTQAARSRKNRAMGFFALPNILIFQILLPLVSPLIDLMFVCRDDPLSSRPALPPGHGERRRLREAAGLLPRLPGHRLRHLGARLLARAQAPREAKATAGCSSISGCSASPTGRSSPSCCSRPQARHRRTPFNWDKLERTAKMSKQAEKIAAGT